MVPSSENIWLRQHGHPLTEWPHETIGNESVVRTEYIAAIKAADRGEYEALMALHRKYTGAGSP